MASSTLCNLLLEFSPSKEPILESGAIDLLCSLTQSESPALRVNGIWALMAKHGVPGRAEDQDGYPASAEHGAALQTALRP
ncbi:UNVERIFIED_CONTAM: hypothetical protein FKN15_064645 [Acipenser sinensis]